MVDNPNLNLTGGSMNTTVADGSLAGGGEILQYWQRHPQYNKNSPYLDNELISQFGMLPGVRFAIVVLILFLMVVVILKIFNIKSPFKGKGITRELDYMEKIKQHDLSILRANRAITWVTNLVESTPFTMNKSNEEYWQYNLDRANIRIPGGSRIIKAIEFNALVMFCMWCAMGVGLALMVLMNALLGGVIILASLIVANTMPLMMIRSTVKEKDLEIQANFADYYMMMHYVLLANAKTPLAGVMKSFAKTTSSKEMIRYIDTCVHYIDTYGEYEATRYISRDYREIPQVGKLMRLIRQTNEGGDIEAELMGFRTELLAASRYALEKRMEKLIAKAKASFNLLMPVLFQAVLSAMSIYISDMGLIGTIAGGLGV